MSCSGRTILPSESDICRISGAADSYGLGIRLGTYLVWTATIIANNAVRDEAEAMRNVNTLYQIATAIALFCYSASRYSLFAVEGSILLALWMGGLCTSTQLRFPTSINKLKSSACLDLTQLGSAIRLLLLFASAGYGLWYAISGLNIGNTSAQDSFCKSLCANDVFFFARIGLYGWYRTLLIVVFSLYTLGVFVVVGWSLFCRFMQGRRTKPGFPEAIADEDIAEVKEGRMALIAGAVAMVIFILAIELTIFWNTIVSVDSVDTVGQLIPFLVGIAAVCRTLNRGMSWLHPAKEKS